MTDSKQERALKALEQRLREEAKRPDPFIDGHYRYLRTRPQGLTAKQQAALEVQKQTLARKDDPPYDGEYLVEKFPEAHAAIATGRTTVHVKITLPPLKGKDE